MDENGKSFVGNNVILSLNQKYASREPSNQLHLSPVTLNLSPGVT